jgi:glycosyltransferase involved in cell wall biosynthesis
MRITFLQPYLVTKPLTQEYYNIQAFGLATELVKLGHEVTILTSNPAISDGKAGIKRLSRMEEVINGFKVVYLPTLGDPFGIPLFPTLCREIFLTKPDVVQCAGAEQIATLVALLVCKLMRKPCVVYQGMYRTDMSHKFLRTLHYKTIGRILFSYADMFICKSTAAKEFILSHGTDPKRTIVIPVGLARESYHRVEPIALEKYTRGRRAEKVLLSVARLVPEKGLDTAILAVKEVVSEFPDVVYLIVGSGSQFSELSKLIKDNGLEGNVFIYTEPVPKEDMKLLYSSVYLYLIPSTYEIFNMTMIEALACGCPVIASREGGMQDVVKHGEFGFLFEKTNKSALAEYIKVLLKDEEKRNRFSKAAEKAMDDYDWSVLARKFDDVYRQLASREGQKDWSFLLSSVFLGLLLV